VTFCNRDPNLAPFGRELNSIAHQVFEYALYQAYISRSILRGFINLDAQSDVLSLSLDLKY